MGIANSSTSAVPAASTMGSAQMSTFDNPFDATRRLQSVGCSCGRHVSQTEHDHDSKLQLQCAPVDRQSSDEKRYEAVVASGVMRAMFPKDAARRAFLKSVGASTALAAISQFFPLKTATEVFVATDGDTIPSGPAVTALSLPPNVSADTSWIVRFGHPYSSLSCW